MAIGPALAGTYMHTFHMSIDGIAGVYPSPESFNMIFLYSCVAVNCVVDFFFIVKEKNITKHGNYYIIKAQILTNVIQNNTHFMLLYLFNLNFI